MKAKFNILLLFCLVLLALACNRKELPEEYVGEPEFYVKGKINGEELNISAGENSYFMHTSYHKDNNEIFNFAGLLKQKDCSHCQHAFNLSFKDNQINKNGKSNINYSLQNGIVQTPSNEPKVKYEVKFYSTHWLHPFQNGNAVQFHWDFGDGTTSTEAHPVHFYEGTQSIYNVCLTLTLPNGYTSQICNTVNLLNTCSANFIATNVSGNKFRFRSISSGVQPISHLWQFESDPNLTANLPEVEYQINPFLPVEKITLTITDATGCISTISKNIVLNQITAGGAVNFTYDINIIKDKQSVYNYSTVDFEYNYNGITYKPAPNASANNQFKMEIVSISDYKENENGQKTKKVEFVLNATLYNGSEKIELENVHGVMGVAYP